MSNKIYITETRNNYVPIPYEKEVNVVEKRAPTDESIKIYHEMIEKAKKEIVDSFIIQVASIECCVVAFCDMLTTSMRDTTEYHVKFKINKTEHCIKFEIHKRDYLRIEQSEINFDVWLLKMIGDKLSNAITSEILAPNLNVIFQSSKNV